MTNYIYYLCSKGYLPIKGGMKKLDEAYSERLEELRKEFGMETLFLGDVVKTRVWRNDWGVIILQYGLKYSYQEIWLTDGELEEIISAKP